MLRKMNADERHSLLVGMTPNTEKKEHFDGLTRSFMNEYGIPGLRMHHAGSGFRSKEGKATCFPSPLAVASTWDPKLAEMYGEALGSEFFDKGVNVLLGPNLGVVRAARGGRNFASLSGEDPHLGAVLAESYIRGAHSNPIMTVAKEFAFGEAEEGTSKNALVDERTAWELYYPPFEAAVKAGVSGVMCAHNMVNGTYACENNDLLQRDLKGGMGFRGFVVSDWGATSKSSALPAELLQNGLDMEMPIAQRLAEKSAISTFLTGMGRQSSDETVAQAIDKSALRVLTSMYQRRLERDMACSTTKNCTDAMSTDTASQEHHEVAWKVASESISLLQNDGVLPFSRLRYQHIAVVGRAANAAPATGLSEGDYYSGGGSGHCKVSGVLTPLEAIRRRAKLDRMHVHDGSTGSVADAIEAANEADVVVVVAATTSQGHQDRRTLMLDDGVDSLITTMARMKPTIVLLQTPGAVLTPWRTKVNAVANMFLGGQATGEAWSSFLWGDVSPAGKLPVMFPASEEDTISTRAYNGRVPYNEGRRTSYRASSLNAAYPFGHGLSYTSFRFETPQMSNRGCPGKVCIKISVANVGQRKGRDIVQAYIELPAKAKSPSLLLRGFEKTRELGPGESQQIIFPFTDRDLSTWQPGQGWKLWDGVRVHFGLSSGDLRQDLLIPKDKEMNVVLAKH